MKNWESVKPTQWETFTLNMRILAPFYYYRIEEIMFTLTLFFIHHIWCFLSRTLFFLKSFTRVNGRKLILIIIFFSSFLLYSFTNIYIENTLLDLFIIYFPFIHFFIRNIFSLNSHESDYYRLYR